MVCRMKANLRQIHISQGVNIENIPRPWQTEWNKQILDYPVRKQASELNRQLSINAQIANTYMERKMKCSTSLAIGRMQIKIQIYIFFNLSPVRIDLNNNNNNLATNAGQDGWIIKYCWWELNLSNIFENHHGGPSWAYTLRNVHQHTTRTPVPPSLAPIPVDQSRYSPMTG